MSKRIRAVIQDDISELKKVIESSELFPPEYLDEMISDYLNNPDSEEIWFTYIDNNKPIAIGYCVPEKFTEGTYNLLSLGVLKEWQGKGIASEMLNYIEQELKQKGARILIIETSSDVAQLPARSLYLKNQYAQEAVIRDFWKDGEDKIVFWKKL